MAQSEYGKIHLFDDFTGPEVFVAVAVAYGGAEGGYSIGPYRLTGDLVETDTGAAGVSKTGGWQRISGNNENGKGAFIGTEVIFSPSLMGPMVLEARVELRILTTTSVFIGFMATNANDVAEPVTSTGTTITYVDTTGIAGFIFDSQLTAKEWHMVFDGGSAAEQTASGNINSGILPVAAESVILRVEVDPDGTVRWYIDGVLLQTQANAVSTTVLLAGGVGAWGTTTTATDIDVDYLGIRANRDWTV